jgi:hypothetical protein
MKQHTEALTRVGLDLLTIRKSVRHYYELATADDIYAGMSWYQDAQALAYCISEVTGKSLDHAAVAIAHLSPRTRWSKNKEYAWALARTGAAGGIQKHVVRAKSALDADDPWSTFGKAPKTRSFAANIRGDLSAVTIDMWAMLVAGVTEQQLGRVGVYEAVAHAFRLEAKRAKIQPAQLQAITWVVARGKAQ